LALDAFRITPNPATAGENIQLSLPPGTQEVAITWRDLSGRYLSEGTFSNSEKILLATPELPGIYLLQVWNESKLAAVQRVAIIR
jgi:hypothetical protein